MNDSVYMIIMAFRPKTTNADETMHLLFLGQGTLIHNVTTCPYYTDCLLKGSVSGPHGHCDCV